MTDDELAAIRARAEAATPGPWKWNGRSVYPLHGKYGWGHVELTGQPGPDVTDYYARLSDVVIFYADDHWSTTGPGEADETFIAAAREDVPALLAEIDRLRALPAVLDAEADALRAIECGTARQSAEGVMREAACLLRSVIGEVPGDATWDVVIDWKAVAVPDPAARFRKVTP